MKRGEKVFLTVFKAFLVFCFLFAGPGEAIAAWVNSLTVDLGNADWTLSGEEAGDWAGYFSSPAGDVNGDGLGDILVGAPMAGEKVCPYPLDPDGTCPGLPKGAGVAYLVLGRSGDLSPDPLNLAEADASFLGCEPTSMTARQLYAAGDVNGDGFDDILVSGWKCGYNYTGKAYLFLGRSDVGTWGRYYPVEQADASFLGENEYDFLSYYVSTAGDVNNDGYDDILITSTHHEYDEIIPPGTTEGSNRYCKNITTTSERYDPGANLWTATNGMQVGRLNHRAVTVGEKILVAGGQNAASFLDSTEEFNPSTGVWQLKGNLAAARANHTLTLLSDGQVLIAGGENSNGVLPAAELYHPADGIWISTGDMNIPRVNHAAVLLQDGRVLVMGGYDGSGVLASAEIFDPLSGSWALINDMSEGRINHTATVLPDGRVLVVGGENEGVTSSSVEIYDPLTGEWIVTSALGAARSSHTSTLLADGRVLVVAGKDDSGYLSTAEIFDPAADAWSDAGRMTDGRVKHTATLLADGRVLVAGGQNLSGSDKAFEIFDPNSNSWAFDPVLTLTQGHANHTAATMPDGGILVAGGRNCTDFGKVYLVLGRPGADWGPDFNLANADASFLGEAVEDRLGRSATGVGDVNGDGYDDFLIGSISSDYAGIDAGQNYLFLGRATPDAPNYDPSRPWWGQDFSVARANASFTGEKPGDESGRRVAWVGDVNGDGLDDMLMQAALNDFSFPDAGTTYLVLGRRAASWGMHFSLANANASFSGERKMDQSGRRISGAGDINGDGYNDILIGAPHNQDASTIPDIIAGKAYVIFGRPKATWGKHVSLALADIIFKGKPDIGVAGYDVGRLDDFNGDGIDDILISAYGGRNTDYVPGDTYILLGSQTPVPVQFTSEVIATLPNVITRFTGEYWDPNGYRDIKVTDLVLDTETTEPMVHKFRYDSSVNGLYLFNPDNNTWLGPCRPGSSRKLTNAYVQLDCLGSRVMNNNNRTLRVTWRVRWLNTVYTQQDYKMYLQSSDRAGNDSGPVFFGSLIFSPYQDYYPVSLD